MPTIAEEIRTWEKTNGHLNRDFENLFFKLIEYSRRNGYELCIKTPDYSRTSFHELKVPLTIDEAKKKYMKEGERAIAPDFMDLVHKVEDYNFFCKQGEIISDDLLFGTTRSHGDKLDEIQITDYMNFLYLAEKLLQEVDYHDPNPIIRQGFRKLFRKKQIEVKDTSPIIVITNPKKDGLLNVLKESFGTALLKRDKGLRVFCYGEDNEKNMDDFYFGSKIKDFDFVSCSFENPKDEYFGIWTRQGYVKASFAGGTDLLGIENKINGESVFGGWRDWRAKADYKCELNQFNRLKNTNSNENKNRASDEEKKLNIFKKLYQRFKSPQ